MPASRPPLAPAAGTGSVCWIDLAAHDLASARLFYSGLFGWNEEESRSNGGTYSKLYHTGAPFGSIYQLSQQRILQGTPSHWLPYVRVHDIERSARLAQMLGGEVLVQPFDAGPARIAVVLDSVGAQMGLWEQPPAESTP